MEVIVLNVINCLKSGNISTYMFDLYLKSVDRSVMPKILYDIAFI